MKSQSNWIGELVNILRDDMGELRGLQDKWHCIQHLKLNYGATEDEAIEAWDNYDATLEFSESRVEYQPTIYN